MISTQEMDNTSKRCRNLTFMIQAGIFNLASYGNTILMADPQKKLIYSINLEEQEREVDYTLFEYKGIDKTFLLKGGKDTATLRKLSFITGSDACREQIILRKDEIISALQEIFAQKTKMELSVYTGNDMLTREIRDEVNRITGFVGDKEEYGVNEVFQIVSECYPVKVE